MFAQNKIQSTTLISVVLALTVLLPGCPSKSPSPEIPAENIPIAKTFSFPVGPDRVITEERDKKDEWYNALDFRENRHLGEDWNKNSGGDSDCGEPVYAAADGLIVYSGNAGWGWGNVLIITHRLKDGTKVQTLYGHLEKILVGEGEVKRRKKIGTIGNADGYYKCHLHFELRKESSPQWNKVYRGYSSNSEGWLDPSDFIEKHTK